MRKILVPLSLSLAAFCCIPALSHAAPDDIYAKDMETMHEAMMVTPTGDADVDFVQGMIPHHEGAVAMAKTLLANGKDPELHKLAEDIIKAQENEIAFMKDWLKKHPVKK